MATPDIETVAQAALALLQTQLPEALAAVDAAQPTPLNPAPPATWLFGGSMTQPQMPAVLVAPATVKTVQDELGYRIQTYTLSLEAYVSSGPNGDVQQLTRIITRYAAAIDNVLRAANTLNGTPGVRSLTQIDQQFDSGPIKGSGLYQSVQCTVDVLVVTD